jgi:hypothetical protein
MMGETGLDVIEQIGIDSLMELRYLPGWLRKAAVQTAMSGMNISGQFL